MLLALVDEAVEINCRELFVCLFVSTVLNLNLSLENR